MSPSDIVVRPSGARFAGRSFACTIGRGGVTDHKVEGDGATPRGVHRVVDLLYRQDRVAAPAAWAAPIRRGDIWSDDPDDPYYNRMVRAPSRASHENLRRADPLYDLILVTDWNWPEAVPGRGSAIFVHRWRRPGVPTEGCVAFSPKDLIWIARRITPRTRLIVI